jgi:hypothetical protein
VSWDPPGTHFFPATSDDHLTRGGPSRNHQADGVGDFNFGRDLRDLRAAPADDLVAVKLSYWLGL